MQADWNQTNTSAVDYIKNKPTIPSAQVQADWNQNDTSAVDYIQNRPFYQVSAEELIGSVTASGSMVQFQLSKPLVDGNTYKVIKNNSTEISVVANDNGSNMIMLLIEDYHIVFYDPNHQVAQSPNNAFYSGYNDNTAYKIYNPPEVVKLPSAYLDGFLIQKGTGVYSNIFNDYSHNSASGDYSHSEGYNTTASGYNSHSEGNSSTASGVYSHSEGLNTTASGRASHSEGDGTIANHNGQHTFGQYNIADSSTASAESRGTYVEIVGNGTGNNSRSNARTLDWSGNEQIAGTLRIGSTSTGGALLKFESNALKVSFDNGTTWKTVTLS